MKKSGNGSKQPALVAPQPAIDPQSLVQAPPAAGPVAGVVHIREEDQKIIREIDQELLRAKMELANLTVQIEVLTGQKQQLVQRVIDLDKGMFERVKKTAGEYGLDLEKSKWNFDAGRMAFSKLES